MSDRVVAEVSITVTGDDGTVTAWSRQQAASNSLPLPMAVEILAADLMEEARAFTEKMEDRLTS